ncbi:hypothetical protein ADUPG1_006545, partial [Aduncisulcus paluster]
ASSSVIAFISSFMTNQSNEVLGHEADNQTKRKKKKKKRRRKKEEKEKDEEEEEEEKKKAVGVGSREHSGCLESVDMKNHNSLYTDSALNDEVEVGKKVTLKKKRRKKHKEKEKESVRKDDDSLEGKEKSFGKKVTLKKKRRKKHKEKEKESVRKDDDSLEGKEEEKEEEEKESHQSQREKRIEFGGKRTEFGGKRRNSGDHCNSIDGVVSDGNEDTKSIFGAEKVRKRRVTFDCVVHVLNKEDSKKSELDVGNSVLKIVGSSGQEGEGKKKEEEKNEKKKRKKKKKKRKTENSEDISSSHSLLERPPIVRVDHVGESDVSKAKKSSEKDNVDDRNESCNMKVVQSAFASSSLTKLTIPVLKTFLKEKHLKVGGKKVELIDRITEFFGSQ